jgi:D-alanine-D-alanine ligase
MEFRNNHKLKSQKRMSELKIGFAYDKPIIKHRADDIESVEAEYEDEQTILWMRSTLHQLGSVVDLPWGEKLLSELDHADIDVVFNVTEASIGRNRESLIPALVEAKGIPCTGTDAVGMGISLDKYITKIISQYLEIPTPKFIKLDSMDQWEQLLPKLSNLSFPLIAKPNTGGSSMGIRNISRIDSLETLYNISQWVLENFHDSVLIEEFISGRELTIALFAAPVLKALPTAEIRVGKDSLDSFYSYEIKSTHSKEIICPADLPKEIEELMINYSYKIFDALQCQDMARVDFRLDQNGVPHFLEINPLPGLSPYYSIFPIQAQADGISTEAVIHQLICNALSRKPGRRV